VKKRTDQSMRRNAGGGSCVTLCAKWRVALLFGLVFMVVNFLVRYSYAVDVGSFQQVETSHFLIYADTRSAEIQEIGRTLEEAYTIVAETLPRMAAQVPLPIEVIYFSQKDDFDTVTLYLVDRSTYRFDMDLPYGFCQLYPDMTRIITTRSLFGKYLPDLYRDVTRMFLFYSIENRPYWLEEGLPGFMGSISRDASTIQIGKLKKDTIEAIRGQGLIPLVRFLKLSKHSSVFKNNDTYLELFRSQAIFFVNFLFYADQKRYQAMLFNHLDNLIIGFDKNQAFLDAFAEGTIPLQAALNQHILLRTMPYTMINRGDIVLQDIGQPVVSSRADIAALLGDEYIRNRNILKAEQFYARGIATEEESLVQQFGMARILFLQAQQEAFVTKLAVLIEKTKGNYPLQRALAFFLAENNDKQTALKLFVENAPEVSNDLTALKQAVSLAIDTKDLEATRLFFSHLLAYFPDNEIWSRKYQTLLLENKDFGRAASLALHHLTRSPQNSGYRDDFLASVRKIDDTDVKASLLIRGLKLLPADFELNYEVGTLYELTGNFQAALVYFKRCLEQSADNETLRLKIQELKKKLPTENVSE